MRVVNNTLTHGDFVSPLNEWRLFSSKPPNLIFSAAITTVLTYQLTALFLDLIFARRHPANTPSSDMHIKLISDEYSPISFVVAVFHLDFLDLRSLLLQPFERDPINRAPLRTRTCVLFKLFLVLIAAPIFNLICVVFTLEIDQTISFANADFGGFRLGVNQNLSSLSRPTKLGLCPALYTSLREDVHPIATVYICSNFSRQASDGPYDPSKGDDRVSVSVLANGAIEFLTESQAQQGDGNLVSKVITRHQTFATISSEGQQFRVATQMDVQVVHSLLMLARNILESQCKSSLASTAMETLVSKRIVKTSQGFTCNETVRNPSSTRMMTDRLDDVITLVDAPDIKVVQKDDSEPGRSEKSASVMTRNDIPFLKRRRSIISQGSLCVALGLVLLLRFFLLLFIFNDVENEIEDVLKRFVGISWCDSLLLHTASVRYGAGSVRKRISTFT